MNVKRILTVTAMLAAMCLFVGISGCKDKDTDSHAGHDHAEGDHDEHAGHDHAEGDHDHDGHDHAEGDHDHGAAAVQTNCPVMVNNAINKEIFVEYKGKKVYFCCPGCDDKFLADPEKYLALLPQFKEEVENAVKDQQTQTIWTCSMHPQIKESKPGKCSICNMNLIELKEESVNAEADAAVAMLTKMLADAGKQTTCPIMDGKKISKTIFTEYKGKKVYFCCAMCIDKFKADPEKYAANLPQFKN